MLLGRRRSVQQHIEAWGGAESLPHPALGQDIASDIAERQNQADYAHVSVAQSPDGPPVTTNSVGSGCSHRPVYRKASVDLSLLEASALPSSDSIRGQLAGSVVESCRRRNQNRRIAIAIHSDRMLQIRVTVPFMLRSPLAYDFALLLFRPLVAPWPNLRHGLRRIVARC